MKKYLQYVFPVFVLILGVVLATSRGSPIPETLTVSATQSIGITIRVGTMTYVTRVSPGATVYDAMNILASTTPFFFSAKRYPDLGYFVQNINGIENSGGAYWTLYINGEYATVGASGYAVREADNIQWKFEKK